MNIRAILETHGIRCPEDSGMPCVECGSITTVCERCHASIQATVRKADGWREWKQDPLL